MSFTYYFCDWFHDFEDEPCRIYSEVGDDLYETRKGDVFKDGRTTRVSAADLERDPKAPLADQPYLPREEILEEVNSYEEFHMEEISAAEFERVWRSAG